MTLRWLRGRLYSTNTTTGTDTKVEQVMDHLLSAIVSPGDCHDCLQVPEKPTDRLYRGVGHFLGQA